MTTVQIPIGHGDFKEVDGVLLGQYYSEAAEYMSELDNHKEGLKETIDAASEVLGIKKGILSKFFKARHADTIKKGSDLAKTLNALEEAVS